MAYRRRRFAKTNARRGTWTRNTVAEVLHESLALVKCRKWPRFNDSTIKFMSPKHTYDTGGQWGRHSHSERGDQAISSWRMQFMAVEGVVSRNLLNSKVEPLYRPVWWRHRGPNFSSVHSFIRVVWRAGHGGWGVLYSIFQRFSWLDFIKRREFMRFKRDAYDVRIPSCHRFGSFEYWNEWNRSGFEVCLPDKRINLSPRSTHHHHSLSFGKSEKNWKIVETRARTDTSLYRKTVSEMTISVILCFVTEDLLWETLSALGACAG